MTPQFTTEAFAALGGPNLVYVRPVKAGEVLGETAEEQAQGAFEIHPNQTLYAVHRADGQRLAVMIDRETAIATAIANDLAPVAVH